MININTNNISETCYIKLPNDIYDDLSISNFELTILAIIYRHYMQYKNLAICSIQMIVDVIRINISNNRKVISDIRDTIVSLYKKEYIKNMFNLHFEPVIINKSNDSNTTEQILFTDIDKDKLFYIELLPAPDSNYFTIFDNDLNKIFKQIEGTNLSKYNLIRYFIACRRVCNCENRFGYLTQNKLHSLVNDSRTIQKYNIILQDDLQLIRYDNNFLTPNKHYCTTFIGDYADEENFNKQLEYQVSEQKLVHTDKTKSNKKRSIKQKINNIIDEKDKRIEELEKQLKELQYKDNKKSEKYNLCSEYQDETDDSMGQGINKSYDLRNSKNEKIQFDTSMDYLLAVQAKKNKKSNSLDITDQMLQSKKKNDEVSDYEIAEMFPSSKEFYEVMSKYDHHMPEDKLIELEQEFTFNNTLDTEGLESYLDELGLSRIRIVKVKKKKSNDAVGF